MSTPSPYYILAADGKTPINEKNILKWGEWFESSGLGRMFLDEIEGVATLSTVFLGIDHGYRGPPVLFETMLFMKEEYLPNDLECAQWRYTTWEDAKAGHYSALEAVTEKLMLSQVSATSLASVAIGKASKATPK